MVNPNPSTRVSPWRLTLIASLVAWVGACSILEEGYSLFVDDTKLVIEAGPQKAEKPPVVLVPSIDKVY